VLRCKIEGNRDIFITTSPDTNQIDGQFARIGISRGIGDRAIVVADRMGATAFVELNADDTPIGLLTVQKDMRLVKQVTQSISLARFWHHPKMRACVLDCANLSEENTSL
jgi:hypothetical protein